MIYQLKIPGSSWTLPGNLVLYSDCISCLSTTINPRVLTATDYQMLFVPTLSTILTFPMHTDTVGDAKSNPIYCGVKKYTMNITWLTIVTPSDPLTQDYLVTLQTNDLSKVGKQTVTLAVEFEWPGLPQMIQNFEFNIIHPCKTTLLTSSQLPLSLVYSYGYPAVMVSFQAFYDSVADNYQTANLCAPKYIFNDDEAIIKSYGMTIDSANLQISMQTITKSLVGTAYTFHIIANSSVVQQTAVSSIVTLNVSVLDPCPGTTISFPNTTLQGAFYIITQSAQTITFESASDSETVTTGIADLCGPFVYSIAENYAFTTVDSTLRKISVFSNDKLVAGTYSATLVAKLKNYPNVAPAQVVLTNIIYLEDPCLTTVLMPSAVVSVSITVRRDTVLRSFDPFKDSAATLAKMPGLCGPRDYSIVETKPRAFLEIRPPISNNFYTDAWTLKCFSQSLKDVGSWKVTLEAALRDYPGVPAVTSVFEVIVVDPCPSSVIIPSPIYDMVLSTHSIYPVEQKFQPFSDTESKFTGLSGVCGPKEYISSSPIVEIVAPASNPDNNFWKISAKTKDKKYQGRHQVTITCTLLLYKNVAPIIVTFNLTVIVPPNSLPTFKPAMPASITIQMTQAKSGWSFQLPPLYDADKEDTALEFSVDFKTANSFMALNDKFEIEIEDLSANGSAAPGLYTILFSISDGKDTNLKPLTVIIKPAPLKKKDTKIENSEKTSEDEDEDELLDPVAEKIKKEKQSAGGGPPPMTLNLKEITQTGMVYLSFSRPVQFAPGVLPANDESTSKKRSLDEQDPEAKINQIVKKAFKITYQPALGSQAGLLDFDIIEFKNATDLSLELHFNDPFLVSTTPLNNKDNDKLQVQLSRAKIFIDPSTSSKLKLDAELAAFEVPKQLPSALAESIGLVSASAQSSVSVLAPGTIAANIFLGVGLKKLWKAISILQFVPFIRLWMFVSPSNLEIFFDKVSFFARGDWIPKEFVFKKLGWSKLDQQQKQIVFLIVIIVVIVVLGILTFILVSKSKKYRGQRHLRNFFDFCKRQKQKIFFNAIIRYSLQSYLDLAVASLLGAKVTENRTKSKLVTTIFLLVYVLLLPMFYLEFLQRKYDELECPTMVQKFGTLYSNCPMRWSAVTYNVEYLMRRLLFAIITVTAGLECASVALILVVTLSVLHSVYLIQVRPFYAWDRKIDLVGEVLLLYCFFGMISCLIEQQDPRTAFNLGWFSIVSVSLLTVLHLVNLAYDSVHKLVFFLKTYIKNRCQPKKKQVDNPTNQIPVKTSSKPVPTQIQNVQDEIHSESSESEVSDQEDSDVDDQSVEQSDNILIKIEDQSSIQKSLSLVEPPQDLSLANQNPDVLPEENQLDIEKTPNQTKLQRSPTQVNPIPFQEENEFDIEKKLTSTGLPEGSTVVDLTPDELLKGNEPDIEKALSQTGLPSSTELNPTPDESLVENELVMRADSQQSLPVTTGNQTPLTPLTPRSSQLEELRAFQRLKLSLRQAPLPELKADGEIDGNRQETYQSFLARRRKDIQKEKEIAQLEIKSETQAPTFQLKTTLIKPETLMRAQQQLQRIREQTKFASQLI